MGFTQVSQVHHCHLWLWRPWLRP